MNTAQQFVAPVAATQSSIFTRDQVANALAVAGKHAATTDADIRRLFEVQFHMTRNDLKTIDDECLDEITVKLLDFYLASK